MDVIANKVNPRFEFGKNWTSFLASIDERRIQAAIESMATMLGMDRLDGLSFLDIGCGSGLSSLAALRLGASVCSFDYDLQCVACTQELQRRFADNCPQWRIERGSALDEAYIQSLGTFDIVYSWGVLHHTGDLDQAMRNCRKQVKKDGLLFIALYNDQGAASRRWATIKRLYQKIPDPLKTIYVASVASWYESKFAIARLARLQNPLPFKDWKRKGDDRGMSAWHDWVDWVGGWPFEVISPDRVVDDTIADGFSLVKMKTVGNGWGCNEYIFRKS